MTAAAIVLVRNQATKTALIEVGAKITLGAVSSTIVVAGYLGTSFVVGWKIGKFALAVERERTESPVKFNEAIDTHKRTAPTADKQAPFDELDREASVKREDWKNDCELASRWQLERIGIGNRSHQTTAHEFKDFWGAKPNKFYDICACRDGSIVIKRNAQCGMPGPSITTDKRWK